MDQIQGTPDLSDYSPEIAAAFEAAFGKDSADRRPTAEEWIRHLEGLENSLVQCDTNPLHFAPKDASDCIWCAMESAFGTPLFLPYVPIEKLLNGVDPGSTAFDLNVIWAKISSVSCPSTQELIPNSFSAISVEASVAAKQAKNAKGAGLGIGMLIIGVAIAAAFLNSKLSGLAWILGIAGAITAMMGKSKAIDKTPFLREYVEAEQHWNRELKNWFARSGIDDFESQRQSLGAARESLLALASEELATVEKYRKERQVKQLEAFLSTYLIRLADVKGIGPAKQSILASYGIDTAADVGPRVLNVPGFGPVNSKALFDWRKKLERRFVFNPKDTQTDLIEIGRIRTAFATKAGSLRQQLFTGAHNLETLARRVRAFSGKIDPVFSPLAKRCAQAKKDLQFLGVSLPNVPLPAQNTTVSSPSKAAGGSSTQRSGRTTTKAPPSPTIWVPNSAATTAAGAAHTCPRCGSSMIRRMAKRGRNAGNYFWGCSRYPNCKGTRS